MPAEQEEWRQVRMAPYIKVSSWGNFVNARTGAERTLSLSGKGYLYLSLWEGGRQVSISAAKLVAEAFFDDYDPHRRVRFLDGDPTNLHVNNLTQVLELEDWREHMPEPRPHATRIRIVELDRVFINARAAAIAINGHSSAIYACCRGDQMQHRGYTFEFVTVQDLLTYQRRRDGAA